MVGIAADPHTGGMEKTTAPRSVFIVEDSRIQTVISQQKLAASLPEGPRHIIQIDSDWARIATYPAPAS